MESSCEGATGEDSVSPWWGAGCGCGFYRHVSRVFGDAVLGVAGQKGRSTDGIQWRVLHVAADQLREVWVCYRARVPVS